MSFYGVSYDQIMKMPMKRFWMLARNIDRIRAYEDQRLMRLMISANDQETAAEQMETLEKQIGVVIEYDQAAVAMEEELDRSGLAELKEMAQG